VPQPGACVVCLDMKRLSPIHVGHSRRRCATEAMMWKCSLESARKFSPARNMEAGLEFLIKLEERLSSSGGPRMEFSFASVANSSDFLRMAAVCNGGRIA
jgi:hypothetical protein